MLSEKGKKREGGLCPSPLLHGKSPEEGGIPSAELPDLTAACAGIQNMSGFHGLGQAALIWVI